MIETRHHIGKYLPPIPVAASARRVSCPFHHSWPRAIVAIREHQLLMMIWMLKRTIARVQIPIKMFSQEGILVIPTTTTKNPISPEKTAYCNGPTPSGTPWLISETVSIACSGYQRFFFRAQSIVVVTEKVPTVRPTTTTRTTSAFGVQPKKNSHSDFNLGGGQTMA